MIFTLAQKQRIFRTWGSTINDDDVETRTDIFSNLMTTEILETSLYERNLYATGKHRRINPNPTNSRETKHVIEINILMGINKLPRYRDFWSSDPKVRDEYITKIMPAHRFG